ncbi:MAG TPA: 3'-5' exonuclease [Gemmatimonas sp.]|nr:3'-5' exonuclease [Gemmatimonas sp.]
MSFVPPEFTPGAGSRRGIEAGAVTRVVSQPTTLSACAAARLAAGPLDATTLMRDVCQVERLQHDAAERMAVALLSSHQEFVHLPSGHWAILDEGGAPVLRRPVAVHEVAPQQGAPQQSAPQQGAYGAAPHLAPQGVPHATATDARFHPSPFDRTPDSSPSLRDTAFAVVDVETTGARASGSDRITEIAIATVRGGEISDVYSMLVNPERLIPVHITGITGITWDMVKDQPCFRHIADEVTSRLAGCVFTAHNASFDWRFVSEELRRGRGQLLAGPKLCTVRLARVLLPQLARRSLDHVTNYFGIDIEARHRAAGDAEATAKSLIRMFAIAEDRGITTWGELEAVAMRPASRRTRTASDKRRRAFPMPAVENHIA